ncbi:hypothetical protein SVIOM342S_09375 [Streptomyces violaceorubidus]
MLDRAAQLETQALALRETVGTGTVADNLTNALTSLFGLVPVAIIPLVTFRDELRARLREAVPGGGIAILAQVASAVSAYLTDERARGRISADADIDSLTLSLVGGGHLLFADRDPGPPSTATGPSAKPGGTRCSPTSAPCAGPHTDPARLSRLPA